MAAQVRANLADVLNAVVDRLAQKAGVDAAQVAVSARDLPFFVPERCLVLRVLGERQAPGWDGAGRVNDLRARQVRLVVRTRLLLDEAGRDAAHLLDASLGHLALEDACADALAGFLPTDGQGDGLTAVPLEPGPFSDPRPASKDNPEWLESSCEFTATYNRALNQAPDPAL